MQEAAVGPVRPTTPDSLVEDAVFRRLDPEALAKVRQFQASPLLDDGRINVIALDPIADRLGDRWESRREQVYEHLERALNKKLSPTDFFLRVSDTVYLVDSGRLKPLPHGEASVPHPAWAWDHEQAKESVRKLAALEPKVVATGHERPLRGENLRETLMRAADKL